MKSVEVVVRAITTALAWLAGLMMVGIMALLVANAVLRSLDKPIFGVVDLVQYMMLTLTMASLAFTQRTGSHISVDMVVEKLPGATRRLFAAAADLLTFAVALALALVMLTIAMRTSSQLDGTGLIAIPTQPFKVFVVIGFFGWALEALLRAYLHVTNRLPVAADPTTGEL
ncbi:TRAP transporter small permease [Nocardioides sp. NPDC051685]|uniref:TRAP transporter small permease n=1 Tax=Nocardioides sp. NPDC051685 TaxID=3364334 RepID=UPI0037B3711E